MRSNGLEKTVLLGMGCGARGMGGPRRWWLDEVVETTGYKIGYREAQEATRDHCGWIRFVV